MLCCRCLKETFVIDRDYRNPDLVNEENEGEEAEEKFTPEEEFRNVSLVKRPATSSTRKRGKFSSLAKNKRLKVTPVSLNLTGITEIHLFLMVLKVKLLFMSNSATKTFICVKLS